MKLTVIICKCGAAYAAAIQPVSDDFKMQILSAARKGHTISDMTIEGFTFGKCRCHRKSKVVKVVPPTKVAITGFFTAVQKVQLALGDDNFDF